jgi:hypothetical protein
MNAFNNPAMEALKERLADPKSTAPPAKPTDRRPAKPADHVREFRLLDGRPIAVDRRSISFLVAHKENPDTATVIGMRVWGAKPVPVQMPYGELRKWWLGTGNQQGGR